LIAAGSARVFTRWQAHCGFSLGSRLRLGYSSGAAATSAAATSAHSAAIVAVTAATKKAASEQQLQDHVPVP